MTQDLAQRVREGVPRLLQQIADGVVTLNPIELAAIAVVCRQFGEPALAARCQAAAELALRVSTQTYPAPRAH